MPVPARPFVICPYCEIGFKPIWRRVDAGGDGRHDEARLEVRICNCAECGRLVLRAQWMIAVPPFSPSGRSMTAQGSEFAVFPASPQRRVAPEVIGEYAQDFGEAAAVLDLSPKASAALSRRLLQYVIREKAGIKRANLDKEIDALIDSNQLPTDLAHDLDMIRHLGNFAAHPIKSTDTGLVVDVEPGEADALLDLLDYYFVRPARRAEKRVALNAKLADAGKPALKGTPEPTPETGAPDPPPVVG